MTMTKDETIKHWNKKVISSRYFVEKRDIYLLLCIASKLDHPNILMFPSRNSMCKAIEMYDMLFENGYFNESLSGKMYNQKG